MLNELPIGVQIFRLSSSFKAQLIFSMIVFGLAIVLGITLLIVKPVGGYIIIALIACLFFCFLLILAYRIYLRVNDFVAVNNNGIWYISNKKDEKAVFLEWSEVANVTAHDYLQRLVLTDAIKQRIIRLEYQLENFQELRTIVLQHTLKQNLVNDIDKTYYKTFYDILGMSLLMTFFVTIGIWSYHDGVVWASLIFFAFSVGAVAVLLLQPRNITISTKNIIVRYPLYKFIVPYDSISAISLRNKANDSNEIATVVIECSTRKPINLVSFKDGSLKLYTELHQAWNHATGKEVVEKEITKEEVNKFKQQAFRNLIIIIAFLIIMQILSLGVTWYKWQILHKPIVMSDYVANIIGITSIIFIIILVSVAYNRRKK